MANSFRGEVTLTHDGQDYTMVLDFNALCEYEDATGDSWNGFFERLDSGAIRATELRTMVWAGLRSHHPDITLPQAGAVLSSNSDAVIRAAAAALPPEKSAPAAKGARGNGKGKASGP
ncbi:gene transfer agent family protein [Paracoccus alkenifer]|uniref:Phage tail tube protein, GTA-gp10 n=1 Tax=Paracoccus alkenifer TaxID=65735 RepID=A0A1H6NGK4_9RHOB|nr:gene transfer agent family protein [Paracoccus alkenifer]SEI10103.1 Phage tail tube protein, GTA-gp10 [Paracoccus alkenifer]